MRNNPKRRHRNKLLVVLIFMTFMCGVLVGFVIRPVADNANDTTAQADFPILPTSGLERDDEQPEDSGVTDSPNRGHIPKLSVLKEATEEVAEEAPDVRPIKEVVDTNKYMPGIVFDVMPERMEELLHPKDSAYTDGLNISDLRRVYTRLNYPTRWYGVSPWAVDSKRDIEKVFPWPDADFYLSGSLVKLSEEEYDKTYQKENLAQETDSQSDSEKHFADDEHEKRVQKTKKKKSQKRLIDNDVDWAACGTVVSLDMDSVENRGFVSPDGEYLIPLTKKQKDSLFSSSGLFLYIHSNGFVPEGTAQPMQPIKISAAGNKDYSIRTLERVIEGPDLPMVRASKYAVEVRIPEGHMGGKVWIERRPGANSPAWDDVTFMSADIPADGRVIFSLASNYGSIRVGGYADNWYSPDLGSFTFGEYNYVRVNLDTVPAFMARVQGVVLESSPQGLSQHKSNKRTRLAVTKYGFLTYSKTDGSFESVLPVANGDIWMNASFQSGQQARQLTGSLTSNHKLQIHCPFWQKNVKFSLKGHDLRAFKEVRIRNYPFAVAAKLTSDGLLQIYKMPPVAGNVSVIVDSKTRLELTWDGKRRLELSNREIEAKVAERMYKPKERRLRVEGYERR